MKRRLLRFVNRYLARWDAILVRKSTNAGENLKRILGSLIRAADAEAWFYVTFNGFDVYLPRDTLRTMTFCFRFVEGQKPLLLVENEHLQWMIAALAQGGTFLDVGALTGATTIPIALSYGPRVLIHAYEPAAPARTPARANPGPQRHYQRGGARRGRRAVRGQGGVHRVGL